MGGIETREASTSGRLGLVVGLLALVVVNAQPAAAGRNVWTPIGPDGAAVRYLAADPTNSHIAYATTDRGILETSDGEHWRQLRAGRLFPVAVDPQTPSTLYAGGHDDSGDGFIIRSSDGGETWSDPIAVLNDLVVDIVIDPQQPRTLYVTEGYAEVGVSRDGGATWTVASLARQLSRGLAVDPRRSGTVHVLALDGVYTSRDYGTTWEFRALTAPTNLASLAIDPLDSDVLYAGAYEGGLFRSRDGGGMWEAIAPELAHDTISALAPERAAGVVYVGTGRGLFRLRDAGDVLEPTALTAHTIDAVAASGATIYTAFSGAGVERSDDGGATWQRASSGLGSASVPISTGADGTLYARSDGVFRSTEHGRRWTLSADGLPGFVTSLVTHPSRPDTLFAGTIEGVLVSRDRGATWRPTGLSFDPPPFVAAFEVRALAIDGNDPAHMYAGTWEGLYASADGGESWQRASSRLLRNVSVSQIVVASNGTVYAAVDGTRSLFVSTDGGASWRLRSREGTEFTALAVDPRNPNTLYAGRRFWYAPRGNDGLYVSRDGGRTWSLKLAESIGAVAVDANGRIFAAGFRRVFRSDDGGASWRPFTAGLPYDINSFAFAPDRPDVVYAGSSSGVFEVEMVEPCHADCSGDGSVGVDDLIAAIAAASGSLDACAVADRDANGEISIAEIVAAVRDAQRPCAGIAEPGYRAPRSVALATLPSALFAVDVDGDRHVDALTVSERDVTLARGDGGGGFVPAPVFNSLNDAIIAARIADLNRDGAIDLVLVTAPENSLAIQTVRVLLNDGAGGLRENASYMYGNLREWLSLAIGDVNGDAVPDLVAGDGTGSVVVRLGLGDGTFAGERTIVVPGCDGDEVYCPLTAVEDLNHDGLGDIVTASAVLLAGADEAFTPVAGGAIGILADLDGDGAVDTLGPSWPDGAFDVRLGGGDGSFAPPLAFASGGHCEGMVSADLNGDGSPDVVCAIAPNWGDGSGESADRVSVALNLGDGAFAMPRGLAVPQAPLAVAAADVDGDGRLDLLAAGQCSLNGRPSCDGTAALTVWLATP